LLFFPGPFAVEGDDLFEDFGVAEGGGPAVGGEDGGVEFVVQLFEDGDQPLFVDGFLFGGQPLPGPPLDKGGSRASPLTRGD
jgi:hypothetical protein